MDMAVDTLRQNESILPLKLEGVCFAANGRALIRDIDLEFAAGPITAILGQNGAGKSLLLRLCHGLLRPSAGRVSWSAPDSAVRSSQAMVFQRPVLLRRNTAENIDYALRQRDVPRVQRRELVEEALRKALLSDRAQQPARLLSGGQQQRLALARAWSLRPQILFLDEPTASLDPAACRAVEEIPRAFAEQGTKVVMATHDLGQARRLADEVIFIESGRVTERTPAREFFAKPRSDPATAFLSGELYIPDNP